MKNLFLILLIVMVLFSCNRKEKIKTDAPKTENTDNQQEQNSNTGWEEITPSVVKFDSYDGNRILESGQGVFIAENLIVTNYSLVSRANTVVFSPLNENVKYTANKFVAVDRINDLVILWCDSIKRKPVELYQGAVPNSAKTMYISTATDKAIQLFTGKVLNLTTAKGTKLYRITNRINKGMFGMPIFVSTKQVVGIAFSAVVSYDMQSFAIPSDIILQLLEKRNKIPATLESLRSNTRKPEYKRNSFGNRCREYHDSPF